MEGSDNAAERARALLVIASSQARINPGESREKVSAAVAYAERSGDQALLLRALRQQRDLERAAGAHDRSLLTAIRVVGLAERIHDDDRLPDDLRVLCETYERTGAYDQAVELRLGAVRAVERSTDDAALGRTLVDLMNTLVLAGRHNEAVRYGEDALRSFDARKDELGKANVWMIQGESILAQQRPADALPSLNRAERVFADLGLISPLARVLLDMAEAYVGMGRFPDAGKYLDAAIKTIANDPAPEVRIRILALRSRYHEGLGEAAAALADLREHDRLMDSLNDARQAERLLALGAFYSSASRERAYTALKDRNTFNEGLVASARARGRWWLVAFATALCGITVLLLMVRRIRRLARRAHLKGLVIQRQSDEIKAQNMELERQNLRLAESLTNEEEKDIQLKEIHHRVKNNLQIVNTLLKMQGTYVRDAGLQEVLDDCQGRVRSMALVHEHIYRVGDLNQVNVKAHLLALAEGVLKQHGLHRKVRLELQVSYDHANLDNLIPLSLLMNELITNSAKHAFVGRAEGRITINLRRMGDQQCELIYKDDGVGLRQEQFFHEESFGLELVRTLATQLDGRIHLLKGEGTTFQMTFVPQVSPLRRAS